MSFKVGDTVLVKAKVTRVLPDAYRVCIDGDTHIFVVDDSVFPFKSSKNEVCCKKCLHYVVCGDRKHMPVGTICSHYRNTKGVQ